MSLLIIVMGSSPDERSQLLFFLTPKQRRRVAGVTVVESFTYMVYLKALAAKTLDFHLQEKKDW